MGVASNNILTKKRQMLQLDEALNALELAAEAKKSIPLYAFVNVSMMIVAAVCLLYFLVTVWSSNLVARRISRRLRYQRMTVSGRVARNARSIYRSQAVDLGRMVLNGRFRR